MNENLNKVIATNKVVIFMEFTMDLEELAS